MDFKVASGETKSYWTILENLPNRYVRARCLCGVVKIVFKPNIDNGKSKSCRCHGRGHLLPEVRAWTLMKYRCLTPTSPDYSCYGGRGIAVCKRWLDFDNFYEDMGPKPFKDATLERINVDKDYSPENCKWLSPKEQAKNRRNTIWVKFQGKKIQLMEAARKQGIHINTVRRRLERGWTIEQALTVPTGTILKKNTTHYRLRFKGKEFCGTTLAKEYGINPATFRWRIRKGWSIRKALTLPSPKESRKIRANPA